MIKRKRVMKDAHELASSWLFESVGDYSIALSFTLKISWAYNKKRSDLLEADREEEFYQLGSLYEFAQDYLAPEAVAGVPSWAIRKDFDRDARMVLLGTYKTEVLQETEKAIKIKFYFRSLHKSHREDDLTTWVAKSILVKD